MMRAPIELLKGAKEIALLLWGNADARIGNADTHLPINPLCREGDGASGFGVFCSIIEEVDDDLLDAHGIGQKHDVICGLLYRERMPLCLDHIAHACD